MDEAGVVVAGAAGRMGRMLVAEVAAMPGLRLVGALARPGSRHAGEDAGVLAGIGGGRRAGGGRSAARHGARRGR